ncbi:MAG: AAA family ATPase [Solirubrobacterales bacterium]
MRFRSLRVANLRAVRLFDAKDLNDFIVVAGQNGSGKSCVFDAIRLLKSVYGGYSTNEYMQWFGEFAIDLQDRDALRRMFRDPTQPVHISGTLEFTASERQYMIEQGSELLWPLAWERVTGQRMDHWSFNRMAIATQLDQYREEVEKLLGTLLGELEEVLKSPTHTVSIEISQNGNLATARCLPAEVSFQAYQPAHLGIIEHHSASRAYTRQALQGINLDAKAFEQERRQQTLYNAQAKYQNVKTELATGYLRNLIAAETGGQGEGEDLNETLKELFRTFFPDKEYEGVRPLAGGSLEFPVRLPGGERHDIDDLSSGEKEILYGYLRLRNSTPRRSVILLDEPELHLNPSLLQGFPDFYYRHLGVAQENQLWLVTHSDTLLRQAIGNSNYRVYHMLTASSSEGNQASEVLLEDDVERAVVDLVGDLAAYRPHAKVVILEGKSEDGFDETFIRRLFPDFAKRVNLVSAGSKSRVRDLYAALNVAAEKVGMANRFFAIVDRDAEGFRTEQTAAEEFTWAVYHVENFLLDPAAIKAAASALAGKDLFGSEEAVMKALKAVAAEIAGALTVQKVQGEINDELIASIKIGASPDAPDIAREIQPSIASSLARIENKHDDYTLEKLQVRVASAIAEMEAFLADGEWVKRFPGRDVLKRFVANHLPGVSYEPFRNLVMDNMALSQERPADMRTVLETILAA